MHSDDGLMARSMSILVVEDDEDSAALLARVLQHHGYAVQVAPDGRTAVRMAIESQPDIMLLDLGLPGIDGCEVARQVREQLPRKRPLLVAVTGHAEPEDHVRSREAGIDLHLVKPANWGELHQIIQRFERVITD